MPGGFHPFGQAGIARMFTGESGGQISWLLPAALILLVVGLIVCGRRPRTDAQRAQFLVWGGWLVGTAGVFSFMSGLFHDYYTVALAPAVAALVAIGTVMLWRLRENTWAAATLAIVTVVTGAWAWVLLGRTPDFVDWLRWAILGAVIVAAAGLIIGRRNISLHRWAAAVAITAALAGPLAYCIQTVGTVHTGGVITAGPEVPGGGPPMPSGTNNEVPDAVVQHLSADADKYTWIAAVPGSTEAGYYQLATDLPVMALGGFGSADPAPTLGQFQSYVAEGRVHYYVESTGLGLPAMPGQSGAPAFKPPGMNGDSEAEHIKDWVKQHFSSTKVDGVTIYDLTAPLK